MTTSAPPPAIDVASAAWRSAYDSRQSACIAPTPSTGAGVGEVLSAAAAYQACDNLAAGVVPAAAAYLSGQEAGNTAFAAGQNNLQFSTEWYAHISTATVPPAYSGTPAEDYGYEKALAVFGAWVDAASALPTDAPNLRAAVASVYSVARSIQAAATPPVPLSTGGAAATAASGSAGTAGKSAAARSATVRVPTLAGVLVVGLLGLVMIL